MVDTFWTGTVETTHGKLLVSVEAVNDTGTDLVLRVQVDALRGFKFDHPGNRGFRDVKLLEGDLIRDNN